MQQRNLSYALLIETGSHAGMVLPLTGDTFTMGREIDNSLVLDSPKLSRYHARIRISPAGTVLLEDLDSTNGTFINGYLLSGVRRLHIGDAFTLAGTIRLRLVEDESAKEFAPPEQWTVPAVEPVRYPMSGSAASPTESETWIAPALAPALNPATTEDTIAPTPGARKSRLPTIIIAVLLMALCATLGLAVYLWFAPNNVWQIIFQNLGLPFPGA